MDLNNESITDGIWVAWDFNQAGSNSIVRVLVNEGLKFEWNGTFTVALDGLRSGTLNGAAVISLPERFENSEMVVLSIKGELLYQQFGVVGENLLNLVHLPSGTYIFQAKSSEKTIHQRLIIQK